MRVLVRKLLRDLRYRPLRNALTFLGVIFGVAGVIAISVTSQSLADAQRLTYAGSQQADLASFTSDLSPTTRNLIERQPNVEVADTRAVTFTRFTSGDTWENLRLVGIESDAGMRLDVAELVSGSWPGRGEIAFDESTRDLAEVEIGRTVAIREAPNEDISYLRIVGFTRSPAQLGAGLLNRATAYTTSADVRQLTGRTGDNFLLVRVTDQTRASQTAQDLSRLLAKRGSAAFGFDVRDPDQFAGSQELRTVLLLLTVFSYLGAALASVLVANTLAAVMSEETQQIGIVKSLGGRAWHVLLTYLGYALAIGIAGTIAGWAVGVVLGNQIASYLTRLTGLQRPPLTLSLRDIGLAILVGGAVTVTASLLPALIHANTRVAVLLRSAGVRNDAGNALLRRATAPISRVRSDLAIGPRNALRRPGRAASTIAVVAVAVAAFVATQALSRSVSGTVDDLYTLYGADAWIGFQQPIDLAYQSRLESDPLIDEVEAWTSASGAFGSTRTDIWGMPEHDPLYAYRLVEGSWVQQSVPTSVVLTSNLAAEIGARVGDVRLLDVGVQRETVQVAGIVNDSSTYLGNTATGKVFMRTQDVNRLRNLGSRADIFAFTVVGDRQSDMRETLETIEENHRAAGPVTYAVEADQRSSRQAINVLTLMLNTMVIVVAVVGIAGIANSLLISISERRREIGVLRSLGASGRHIVTILVGEGVMLAFLGLVIGSILGYPLARLLVDITGRELFELQLYLSLQSLAGTFLFAILAVAAVSALPGLVAGRIRPIQVLRYE